MKRTISFAKSKFTLVYVADVAQSFELKIEKILLLFFFIIVRNSMQWFPMDMHESEEYSDVDLFLCFWDSHLWNHWYFCAGHSEAEHIMK